MTIDMLKTFNANHPGKCFDRKFVGALLITIFGVGTLRVSSLYGNIAHSGIAHTALNTTKIEFVRKLYKLRVGNDDGRLKKFNAIVNRHCNNSRPRQPQLN